MSCCNHCLDSEKTFFGDRAARKELRRYRKKGPLKSTRLLVEAVRALGAEGRTLLDVGGGVGAIQHELMPAGVREAVHVDASRPYLAVSREEARARGYEDRTTYRYGDFVELAPEVDQADIVTLDRVICCYPDMERLVGAAAERAGHALGIVVPRERRPTAFGMRAVNFALRLRGRAFRLYLHPHAAIEATARRAGMELSYAASTILWQVYVFVRTE
jgi:2-polyprenyl-3-methyl-5-hydroxy-6-metoxy-1,4-benzoquinol methylase